MCDEFVCVYSLLRCSWVSSVILCETLRIHIRITIDSYGLYLLVWFVDSCSIVRCKAFTYAIQLIHMLCVLSCGSWLSSICLREACDIYT